MRRKTTVLTIAVSVPAFAVAGAVSRYNLRMTETRWQIAAFTALAAGVELMLRLSGPGRASVIRGTLNAASAAVVIVSVKFHLEPAARKQDGAIARHAAETVVKAATNKR